MKAVVFHGIGDIKVDNVPDPKIEKPDDAVIKVTSSAICGTDLHMIRGTLPGMKKGTILGHEAVGIVEEIGKNVRNLRPGDRVVVPSTISCGFCSYCRAGYHAQCDNANPNGTGTAFFGGPEEAGAIDGLQAEFARIPFANAGLVKLTDDISDDQAILVSDIFPTGYFGADIARIKPGESVAVFGCGPVGQFTIASCILMKAGRIFAIDNIPSRLKMAQSQGAEVINFDEDDPVEALKELTGGIGVDRVIDAVGVDARCPHHGPGAKKAKQHKKEFEQEVKEVAPDAHPQGENWIPGDAPSQVLRWMVDCVAKAGTLSIIGVYSSQVRNFPIGDFMNKNLKLNAGNCNHRRYIPELLSLVRSGTIDPLKFITKQDSLVSAIDAYLEFDRREAGWLKVQLDPQMAQLQRPRTQRGQHAHLH